MIVKEKVVKDYLTKSNLPASDYVINPYIGCTHACKYCYACFMKRFTKHDEPWGEFLDVKRCERKINLDKIKDKSVFIASVTDCYNSYENEFGITRNILEQLTYADASDIGISTKSDLVIRDIDIIKKIKNVKVALSINTLNEDFRADMDCASSIANRISALKELHDNGIYTVLFMSPIFPKITDFKQIIENTKEFVNEYWFENLNLRGTYKKNILNYIAERYPEHTEIYKKIYINGDKSYWDNLAIEIEEYCQGNNIKHINYFYHEDLVRKKKEAGRIE